MSQAPSLSIRTPQLAYTAESPVYWFGENPCLSHLLHGLSFLFPPGEEAFVRSVQRLRHHVKDPALNRAIDAFIAQESLHGAQHRLLNRWLTQRYPSVEAYTQEIQSAIRRDFTILDRYTPRLSLAITVALEHLTAIAATALLERPQLLAMMQEPMRSLLVWHALEEIEHRSLAYEVYQAAGGGYALRTLAMLFASFMLTTQALRYQFKLLHHDRQLWNGRAWGQLFKTLFGKNGYARGLLGPYLAYWSPRFHPAKGCQHISIEEWQKTIPLKTPSHGPYPPSAPL